MAAPPGPQSSAEQAGRSGRPSVACPETLSGGEIHRLGLLRAWLRDRPVEVLDEPTAFLDAQASEQVRAVIRERSQQRLIVVSNHDPALIQDADALIELTPSQL